MTEMCLCPVLAKLKKGNKLMAGSKKHIVCSCNTLSAKRRLKKGVRCTKRIKDITRIAERNCNTSQIKIKQLGGSSKITQFV